MTNIGITLITEDLMETQRIISDEKRPHHYPYKGLIMTGASATYISTFPLYSYIGTNIKNLSQNKKSTNILLIRQQIHSNICLT